MRSILAGLLIFLTSTVAMAQVQGTVVNSGIGGYYRPNCWVPLKIALSSLNPTAQTYRIQVIQEDLDRDKVTYSRPITLNASANGRATTEQFWVYFLPNPKSDAIDNAYTEQQLSDVVQVILCDESGKPIQRIPFGPGTLLHNLDLDAATSSVSIEGSVRFVVGIADPNSQPNLDFHSTLGLMEAIRFERISPNDLPTNPLGFQCVDHILWSHADPQSISQDLLSAISLWVQKGGKLVVSQPPDWQKIRDSSLAPLLPVEMKGIEEELGAKTLSALGEIPDSNRLNEQGYSWPTDFPRNASGDPWRGVRDLSFPLVVATPKPGAKVDFQSLTPSKTPYLVRWSYGMGAVTWIAQDLGNPSLKVRSSTTRDYGWSGIWLSVLGVNNKLYLTPEAAKAYPAAIQEKSRLAFEKFPSGSNYNQGDAGKVNESLTEISGRAAALVSVAILFFLGYWLLAALGSHFLLVTRKRVQHSWVAFGICAVIATAITALFVKLVLRGPPELAYVAYVRNSAGQTRVTANVGLLVKQDGALALNIPNPGNDNLAGITPLPVHPFHNTYDVDFVGFRDYEVPVPEISSKGLPSIKAPFRGTLKKFQLNWSENALLVSGNAYLGGASLSGVLTNNTGHDLKDVYLAYAPLYSTNNDDVLVKILSRNTPVSWSKNSSLDLGRIFQNRQIIPNQAKGQEDCVYGFLNSGWMRSVFDRQLVNSAEGTISAKDVDFIAMSLFDRIQTPEKSPRNSTTPTSHYRIRRWATRDMDISHAVAAGNLVILASAADTQENSQPPIPFLLDGKKVSGSGTIYYQFVIPLSRPAEAPVESAL